MARLSKQELAQLQKLLEKFQQDDTVVRYDASIDQSFISKVKNVEDFVWDLLV